MSGFNKIYKCHLRVSTFNQLLQKESLRLSEEDFKILRKNDDIGYEDGSIEI